MNFGRNKKNILNLDPLQKKALQRVQQKIKSGVYKYEEVNCLCGANNFTVLSEIDRYGLPHRTVICKACGLIYTNPRFTQDSYNKFYKEDYRDLYVGQKSMEDFIQNQYNKGKEALAIFRKLSVRIKDKVVLDIGCGAGGTLLPFRESGAECIGYDYDNDYLEYGRDKLGLNLLFGGINEIFLEKRKADIIILSHVFEHLLDPHKELEKLHEILKDDGWLYISVPGIYSIPREYNCNLLLYLQNAHVYNYTLELLNKVVIEHGFKLIFGNEKVIAVYSKNKNRSPVYIKQKKYSYKIILNYLRILNIITQLHLCPFGVLKSIKKGLKKIKTKIFL